MLGGFAESGSLPCLTESDVFPRGTKLPCIPLNTVNRCGLLQHVRSIAAYWKVPTWAELRVGVSNDLSVLQRAREKDACATHPAVGKRSIRVLIRDTDRASNFFCTTVLAPRVI